MYKNTSYSLGLVRIKLPSIKSLDRTYADFCGNFCFVKDKKQIVEKHLPKKRLLSFLKRSFNIRNTTIYRMIYLTESNVLYAVNENKYHLN